MSSCIIITPAHNEAAFIEETIGSMINQTVRPLKWIVVNDASTDRTGDIVADAASRHPFIELVNVQRPPGRHFANKAAAFKRGLAQAQALKYDYIGNMDADISFSRDYLKNVLSHFAEDPGLGIAGGIIYTRIGDDYITQDLTNDSVAGAVQLFRRACYERIGGYRPMPYGGMDAAAEIMARMSGWKVQKFPDTRVFEHRRTGTATRRPIAARAQEGRRFHSLGYGFLFFFLRCVYRVPDRPWLIGSCGSLAGYLESLIRRRPIVLPPEVVHYLRAEQKAKLKRSFKRAGGSLTGSMQHSASAASRQPSKI